MTPLTRSTWTEAAAASTASAATRPRLSRARRRRPTTQRCGTLRRAWRGASRHPSSCRPLRRTTRSSRWRNRPNPTPLAPRPRLLALMRDSVTRPHVSPSSAFSPHLTHLSLYLPGLRPNLWMEWREGRDASSTLGSDEAGDGGMDKATDTPPGYLRSNYGPIGA
jgi:hypothetical protein